ncbi:hypothetical protein GGR02_002558 [Anoxybacillus voinovskiensis]|uniref:Uncharacterized protein n=1 Tax=Anoxybacteroides voinovskiense TaxID=230470 RepID=A0A840DT47_9BACL|nr:hypothetical protein [Anoxybacillus voinovskiensis]MBB4074765.1 hypothetical protein [Anoxybacillus voinovskiensis]GGJ72614.1 hypothetical protein GCM10008982_22310 [Anoxybacillus voinovskiensis]
MKKERDVRQSLYDEEAVQAISEQIMDAYQSGVIEQEEGYYHPRREAGE